ncbi:MAG: hypothetical protein P0Y62_02720 [Candidatus Chryseobacterium colombiense]|nr:hypothetical protein [Chryseobacterium sp.]WEK70469.1 MAG: hypothetical protein P0Y62_02720 [Chryseobacterium sp.]
MIISILFFPERETNKDISGTWKLNLYTMDSDTVFMKTMKNILLITLEKFLQSV